jgi:hypothetical protein
MVRKEAHMMILETLGERTRAGQERHAVRKSQATIDLPTDIVMHDDTLIDQILTFTFDVLGVVSVELRICERAPWRGVP